MTEPTTSVNPYQAPLSIDPENPLVDPTGSVAGLGRVRIGLNTIYFGVCVAIGAFILALPAGMLLSSASGGFVVGGFFLLLLGLGMLGGSFAVFVGQIYCCGVPAVTRARDAAVLSASLSAAQVLLVIGSAIFGDDGTSEFSVVAFLMLHGPTFLLCASAIAFATFLKRLNLYLNQEWSARSAGLVRGMVAIFMLVYFIAYLASFYLAYGNSGLAVSFAWISLPTLGLFVLALVTFIKYINLVRLTAVSIGRLSKLAAA
ncbi:MAG: hypothetical protein AAGJ83_03440 [Planctomycetota bacterium]